MECCESNTCCDYEYIVHKGESFNYENFKWCLCPDNALVSFQKCLNKTVVWSTGTVFDHYQVIPDTCDFNFDAQTTANILNACIVFVVGFGGENAVTDPCVILTLLTKIKAINPNVIVSLDVFEDMAKHGGIKNYKTAEGVPFVNARALVEYMKTDPEIEYHDRVFDFSCFVLKDNIDFYTKYKGLLCHCVSDKFLSTLCSYTFEDKNSSLFGNLFFRLDICDPDKALERMVR